MGGSTKHSNQALHVPARDIPVPSSVSSAAQAVLSMGIIGPQIPYPALDDTQAWLDQAALEAAQTLEMLGLTDTFAIAGAGRQPQDVGGVHIYTSTPSDSDPPSARIYIDLHGGAWFKGGGELLGALVDRTARAMGIQTCAVDYRMPPDHPFPAALDDIETVYRSALADRMPADIVIGGTSAGANLAAAAALRMRDRGLPPPAAIILNTPSTDLTMSGDTWHTNMGIDNVLAVDQRPAAELYAGGHDLTDPYLSPLFGDFRAGFPPTILLSGTRDPLLSDTVRLHRALLAAEVKAELHVFEASGHIGFLGQAPEDADRANQMRLFMQQCWGD